MSQKEKKLEIVQKYYIRKKDGEIDYEHPYDLIQKSFNLKGMYSVRLGENDGYMNENGEFVVPLIYDHKRINYDGEERYHTDVWFFCGANTYVNQVCKNNRVGVINNLGEEIVPCEFEDSDESRASIDFIPVALSSQDNSKLDWGIYDIKNKQVSVIPQYEKIGKETNGYASFKKNNKWGLLHCASGKEVIPAIYLTELAVSDTGIVIAFLGGRIEHFYRARIIIPENCHILVVNGSESAQLVVSGYKWIEQSGPSVMKCNIEKKHNPKQKDSFKILKMPNYIAMVKNATYESGYLLQENGKFVKEWTVGCTTMDQLPHARYISGGDFSAITYDGKSIPVTNQMKLEILKRISEE